MTVKEKIFKEIENVSESCLGEVLDFIRFLEMKEAERTMELAIASETALKKGWLRPEEDEAWKSL